MPVSPSNSLILATTLSWPLYLYQVKSFKFSPLDKKMGREFSVRGNILHFTIKENKKNESFITNEQLLEQII